MSMADQAYPSLKVIMQYARLVKEGQIKLEELMEPPTLGKMVEDPLLENIEGEPMRSCLLAGIDGLSHWLPD